MSWESEFRAALRDIRKESTADGKKVKVRFNVGGCCRSCISADSENKLGMKTEDPGLWSYAGQGGRVLFDTDGIPMGENMVRYSSYERKRVPLAKVPLEGYEPEQIYFNHDNGAASVALRVFAAHGIHVEWDGTESQCLIVYGPSKEQLQELRDAEEQRRLDERKRREREQQQRRIEALRREADELESSLA